jgi:hypothetical protein
MTLLLGMSVVPGLLLASWTLVGDPSSGFVMRTLSAMFGLYPLVAACLTVGAAALVVARGYGAAWTVLLVGFAWMGFNMAALLAATAIGRA